MAVTVINASNSRTEQLVDGESNAMLLVTRDGYIVENDADAVAYAASGGGATVTIDGMLIAGRAPGAAGMLLGVNNDSFRGGGNQVTVTASGLVQGARAIALFGGSNSLVNHGLIRGTGTDDTDAANRPGGVTTSGPGDRIDNFGTIVGFYGIHADGGTGSIAINNAGTITGNAPAVGGAAIVATRGGLTLTNSGEINGAIDGVNAYEIFFTNSGVFNGGFFGSLGVDAIVNRGTFGGANFNSGVDRVFNDVGGAMGTISFGGANDAGGDTVNNYGSIFGVNFGGTADNINNVGTVSGNVQLGGGDDVFENSGTIGGSISAGSGRGSIVNSGTIGQVSTGAGDDLVANLAGGVIRQRMTLGGAGSADADLLINDGTIGFDLDPLLPGFPTVQFGDGADRLRNTGTIRGAVDMGADNAADEVINTGTITGALLTGGGNDTVDTAAGTITGRVDLGAGADNYTGSAASDRVTGGTSTDTIALGGGDDIYFASNNDGADTVDGGAGDDVYNAAAVTVPIVIDLGGETTSGTIGIDAIAGFEHAIGGRGGDTLIGSAAANRLDGGAGTDNLAGEAGDDRLIGGAGADRLTGGAGRDVMTGGTEGDTFVFADGDTGSIAATRDVITDFTGRGRATDPFPAGADTIDLSAIDANTGAAGDQAFSFNASEGAAFSGAAGSLVWRQIGTAAILMGDVDGNGVADFAIQLNGQHMLFAADFVL